MVPTLYYLPPSPPCRSVLLLGRMLGIDFDLKTVNVLEGEHLKQEFIQINPQHTIPTMNDHGLVIWESRAIMTYLVSMYGKDDKLYPKDPKTRALVDHRLQFDLGTLYQRMTEYFFPVIFLKAYLDETKKSRLSEALRWFEVLLKGRTYAAADTFTVADICLCVTVSQIEAFGFELVPYKNIRSWLKKCKEELEPFGYEDINQSGADTLAGLFLTKNTA